MSQISTNLYRFNSLACVVSPPKTVSLELKDESPPNSNFDISEFLRSDEFRRNDYTFSDNTPKSDNDYLIHSVLSLSGEDNPNQQNETNNCDDGVNLLNLLNAVDIRKGQKPDDFQNSLNTGDAFSSTQSNTNNLSDILSDISFPESGIKNIFKESFSPECDFHHLSDMPEEPYVSSVIKSPSEAKLTNGSDLKLGINLSDMLSSICIEDSDSSIRSKLNESTFDTFESNVCLGDIDYLCDLQRNGINCSSEFSSKNSDLSDYSLMPRNGTESDSYCCNNAASGLELRDESTNSPKSSPDENGLKFSFFDDHSTIENLLSYNPEAYSTKPNFNSSLNTSKNHAGEEFDNDKSMLDLFNTLNGELSKSVPEYESKNLGSDAECAMEEKPESEDSSTIDLSLCIKRVEDNTKFSPIKTSPTHQTVMTSSPATPDSRIFMEIANLPPIIGNAPSLKVNVNTKQSLFAKALSCKAKRNPSLMQGVAKIKSDLFQNYFSHPLSFAGNLPKPLNMSSLQCDHRVGISAGIRMFMPVASCELM